jgi:SulP family sulfate permease
LPQAVAFAAIAGLPPENGPYTAMVPPVIAALFGSSLVMVSGPTTGICAVVFSAVAGQFEPGSPEFTQGAILLALLVGLTQLLFAMAQVGRLAGFVSHSVMIGFTAAAAILICVSQLGPAIGLAKAQAQGVLERIAGLAAGVPSANPVAVLWAIVTLAAVILFRRHLPRWPGFLNAIVVGAVVVQIFGHRGGGSENIARYLRVLQKARVC